MPSFRSLRKNQPEKFKSLVAFLGRLKSESGDTGKSGGSGATPESGG
jgi:hypothetical protein